MTLREIIRLTFGSGLIAGGMGLISACAALSEAGPISSNPTGCEIESVDYDLHQYFVCIDEAVFDDESGAVLARARVERDASLVRVPERRRLPQDSYLYDIGRCVVVDWARAAIILADYYEDVGVDTSDPISRATQLEVALTPFDHRFGRFSRFGNYVEAGEFDDRSVWHSMTEFDAAMTSQIEEGILGHPEATARLSFFIWCAVVAIKADFLIRSELLSNLPTDSTILYGIWYTAQHSDHDLALQRSALRAFSPYQEDGSRMSMYYAFLYDRLAINEGRSQRYATQYCRSQSGVSELCPVEDDRTVDVLRARSGLEMMTRSQ